MRRAACVSRREFLRGGGALVVSFALRSSAWAATHRGGGRQRPGLPGSLKTTPLLDSWIRIDGDGAITVFTGKVELGQGIKTALMQVAAEELVVEPRTIQLVTADTGRTPDEALYGGQPVDAGQRDRDPPCGGAGTRTARGPCSRQASASRPKA